MQNLKIFFAGLFLSVNFCLFAQDTIKVMQYNLLYYNSYNSFCTLSNNNVESKNEYLRTIIDYVKPDIFTVNEVDQNNATSEMLLNSVMNADGRDYYGKGNRTNWSNSSIINGMFYNKNKLVLHSQDVVLGATRDINIYKLYHKNVELFKGDTAWLTCIVVHLKAGSYDDNVASRADEVSKLMNYLNAKNQEQNCLIMGDFNVYSDNEGCFQNLTNHPNSNIRFYDPINKIGNWNNNSYYSDYHTQSTHTSDNGCASTGGFDDRFDFILSSMNVITGSKLVKYITNSYHALGQDGNHFNSSLVASPTNNTVPSNVLDALYNNSDHLPVVLDLNFGNIVGEKENSNRKYDFYCNNNSGFLSGQLTSHIEGVYSFRIFSTEGRLLESHKQYCYIGNNIINFENRSLVNGLFFIQSQSPEGEIVTIKVAL